MQLTIREAWIGAGVTITCGSTSVSGADGIFSEATESRSSPEPNYTYFFDFGPGSIPSNGEPFPVLDGQPGTIPTYLGYTSYTGAVTMWNGSPGSDYTQKYISITEGHGISGGLLAGDASFRSYSTTTSQSARAIVAIPFYDAEACYIFSSTTATSTSSGTQYTVRGYWFGYTADWNTGVKYNAYGRPEEGGGLGDTTAYSDSSTSSSWTCKLVCNAGTFDSYIPNGNVFYNETYDTVPETMATYSSAHGSALYSPVTTAAAGLSPASLSGIPFSFVGWA
jgi:hypothetical protein